MHGTRDDAEALWDEVTAVLAPMSLRLSEEKTRVCHIDDGFDFLGWHIQRRQVRRHRISLWTDRRADLSRCPRHAGPASPVRGLLDHGTPLWRDTGHCHAPLHYCLEREVLYREDIAWKIRSDLAA